VEVSEIFGPTLQGEGPSIGTSAIFVRTRRCNLQCTWCDTRYTWDKEDRRFAWDYHTYEPVDVAKRVKELANPGTELVVFTGGEPLLWQGEIAQTIDLLSEYGIEIETNGTIIPYSLERFNSRIQYNICPKTSNSDMDKQVNDEAIHYFAKHPNARFKFVVTLDNYKHDLEEIQKMCYEMDIYPVTIMPEGVTLESQIKGIKLLSEPVAHLGLRLIPRMHIIAWENEGGR